MKKKNKNKTHYLRNYVIFCILRTIVLLTPLSVFFALRFNIYFGNKQTCISNALGLILLLTFIILVVTSQTNFLKGLRCFFIVSIIFTLLSSIIDDIVYLSWLSFGSAVMGKFMNVFVTRYKLLKDTELVTKAKMKVINATKEQELEEELNIRG